MDKFRYGLWDGDTLIWRFGWIDHVNTCVNHTEKFIKTYQSKLKLDYSRFFIGSDDKSNFRYKVSEDYKAQRVGATRPPNEAVVRDYLLKSYSAVVVKGAEVDDALGGQQCLLRSRKVTSIILTNDKDLDMIPGWHCDLDFKRKIQYKDKVVTRRAYKKKRIYKVEDPGGLELVEYNKKKILIGTGQLWFCAQMLLGDNADNIPSISKLSGTRWGGPVKVYATLKDAKTFKEAALIVLNIYKEFDAMEDFKKNAQLLWIKRKKGKEKIFDFS